MEKEDLDLYKWALLKKRGELSANGAAVENLSPQITADLEGDFQIRLHQTDGGLLRAVEGALARIRLGTFGICEVCKKPVSRARLESVPWTRLCRDCKEHQGE
jgi:DnaK suppressor protein